MGDSDLRKKWGGLHNVVHWPNDGDAIVKALYRGRSRGRAHGPPLLGYSYNKYTYMWNGTSPTLECCLDLSKCTIWPPDWGLHQIWRAHLFYF
jgi:hypothetical protein